MSVNPLLSEPVEDFAVRLEAMTDEELFTTMNSLEEASEAAEDAEETLARIALSETEIERRYPGELLAPYRNWKQRQPLS
ncbi:hypothetical protein Rleg9DRAFT_0915 [Rhizobium leguminosarum bv. trifolii WSM597]|uniref:Uncharacterized protein n=1 Tax=Rhizobium leguminosarum bv. trifolii WSM597 TaxID=754764 RepID=J0GWX2_RHILT|nr:hypothetical protein [Rhizobium leguminosarum]EJB02135.1 hypothetical protein Rleg9DRAFT_0915 [Rhizobium leguminosarum bv. trifolii WSM597]